MYKLDHEVGFVRVFVVRQFCWFPRCFFVVVLFASAVSSKRTVAVRFSGGCISSYMPRSGEKSVPDGVGELFVSAGFVSLIAGLGSHPFGPFPQDEQFEGALLHRSRG